MPTGKSSLIVQFVKGQFVEPYYPTIEQSYRKSIPYRGTEYDVQIIDTAGQDEYSLLSAKYAVGIHGYILVYSVNSSQSFDMVRIVYDKLKGFQVCVLRYRPRTPLTCQQDISHLPTVVVGQKSDLEYGIFTSRRIDENAHITISSPSVREVSQKEGEDFAKERGLRWIEASAKTNANVSKVFDVCLEEIEKAMHPTDPNAPAQAGKQDKEGCIIM